MFGERSIIFRLVTVVCLLVWGIPASAQLSANFSADPLKGCAPIRILFKDESTGAPDRWRWDLGNGTISTSKDPSTTYFTPGVYTIKLTVYKGTDSSVLIKSNYISVFSVPTASFAGNPLQGCAPMPVQFTDRSIAGSGTLKTWRWDFGDGSLSPATNPNHIYRNQGIFRVTLTVTNSEGCTNSASIDNYVTVLDSVEARFNASYTPSCLPPVSVTFSDASVGRNIVGYRWDFGDGATSTARNPVHTYTTSGTYDVRLIVTNSSGCSDTLLRPGLVSAGNLKAGFNANSTYCANEIITLNSTATPAAQIDSIVWVVSDGTTYRSTNLVKIFNLPGVYSITQKVYQQQCSDELSRNITVNPSPAADFTSVPAEACKPPLTVSFNNTNPSVNVLYWNFGNGQTSTNASPTMVYNNLGLYTVKMAVQNSFGCIDTIVKAGAVRIFPPKITKVRGLPYKGCFPASFTFTPEITTPDPVVSYQWDFGDGTSSTEATPSKTYTVDGEYIVRLVITTASGCTDTLENIVLGSPKPKANFTGGPRVVCPSTFVNFTDLSTGTINAWRWLFGDGGESSERNPTYRYNDTGWMNVRLIVFNNGCADSITFNQYIYVNPPIATFTDSFDCADQRTHFFVNKSIGALRWSWDFGDGNTSGSWDAVHTYKDTGTYTVRLKVADNLCEHETAKQVYVLQEKADFVMENLGGCDAKLFRISAKGPNTRAFNIRQFEWTLNDSIPFITDTGFIERVFYDTASIKLKLKIWDLNGCVDSITKIESPVFTNVIANFGPAFQNVCLGALVNFTDSSRFSSSNPIKKWIWNFGDGRADTLFTAGPFQTRYFQPGVYTVSLITEDELGCRDTLIRPDAVIVHKSKADFVSADTLVCLNTPVHFQNRSIGSYGAPLTFKWNFGNGGTDIVSDPVTSYNKTGKYDIRLVITDVYGCQDTLFRPKYITVADARADFAMSDSFSTCPPLLVNFTNKSASNVQNIWSFGNGNTSTLVDPSHTYTLPGTFTVKLKVVGNGGCSDSTTRKIVIQGPSGSFTYAPLSGCPPLKVDFVANAINTKFYTWDFSDGQSDVTINATASHLYDVPGTFVPRLILEDGLGCKLPVPGPDTIRIFTAEAKIGKLSTYQYCDSATISFADLSSSTDVITRYSWNFGDGSTSALRNPIHTFNKPGRYVVSLQIWTRGGCYKTDTLNVPVVIAPSPQLAISGNNAVCVPASVQFTGSWLNQDTTTLQYKWDFGNGQTADQLIPAPVFYNKPGNYAIRFSAVNNYGCTDQELKTLVVNDTPRVKADPETTICFSKSVTLQATGALNYAWSNQPGLSCYNCSSPVAKPVVNTTYRVVGTDANGCQSSDTVTIGVQLPGSLSVGPGDTICVGESVQLRSNGFEVLRWSPATGLSDANSLNPIAKPLTTTNYVVTGSDPNNCFTQSATVRIVVYPIPTVDIIENFIQSDPGATIPIRTKASSDVSRWRWSPTVGLSCADCPQPFVTITKKERYTADVSNDAGCRAQDNVAVEPICVGESVFVPNTFSPNGDGNNDVFYLRGKGVNTIKRMQIFNRWGELMYERTNFQLNDPTAGWNGTYKGVLLTPDVYVYLIDGVCGNNQTFYLKGNVTLLR